MKQIVILALCNNEEQERLEGLLQYRYDIKLIVYDSSDYIKFLDYLNTNNIDLILIDKSVHNKLTILNRYQDKSKYNRTIIVDDYNLECYKYLEQHLYNIFSSNYNKDLLDISIDIIRKIDKDLNIPLYHKINSILNKTNLPNNNIGYKYIKKAIYESFNDPSLLDNFDKCLYPLLSNTYHKSTYSIEKAMRTTIHKAMYNHHDEYNDQLFSKYITYDKSTPTTQEYILTIVDNLLIEYGKVS